jgi:hypothetical protein
MAEFDRQVEVGLNGCRSTCAYVYEVIPVGQHLHVGQLVLSVNPCQSKWAVGQHYVGQSTPHQQIKNIGNDIYRTSLLFTLVRI